MGSAPTETTDMKMRIGSGRWDVWTEQMLADVKTFLGNKTKAIAATSKAKIRANKSVRTQALLKAIKPKVQMKKSSKRLDGRVWAGVGVDSKVSVSEKLPSGKVVVHKPYKYSHFIEKGFTHAPDGTRIDGKPFLSPSVAENGGSRIGNELKVIVDNAAMGMFNSSEDLGGKKK